MDLKGSLSYHNSPPSVPYAKPDQSNTPPYLLKIRVCIIFPYLPARFKWSPSFKLIHQHPVCTYSLLHTFPILHHLRRRYINSGTWQYQHELSFLHYAILHYKFSIISSMNSVKRGSSCQRQDAVLSDWRERRKRTTDSSPKPIWEKKEK